MYRTEDLREWGDLIRSCVVKKKDEFGQVGLQALRSFLPIRIINSSVPLATNNCQRHSFRWSQRMSSGGTERQWRDTPGGLRGCCWANFDNVFAKTTRLQRQLQHRQHRQIHYWLNLLFFRQRGRRLALVPPSAQLCASTSNQVDGHCHDDDDHHNDGGDGEDDGDYDYCVVVAEL